MKYNQEKVIDSHIQMPKLLLKRFHNDYNRFYYYDVKNRWIGKNGRAASLNTEEGYYSIYTEDFLRDNIETPFSKVLELIEKVDFELESFSLDSNFEEVVRNFIYALIARDPSALKEMDNSIFSFVFSEQENRGFMVEQGIGIANNLGLLKKYIVTFMVNDTEVPFVLPICGIYSFLFKGKRVVNLPISSKIAISLIEESAAELLITEGVCKMFHISDLEITKSMNEFAFSQQLNRQWGYVICTDRGELNRLCEKINSDR